MENLEVENILLEKQAGSIYSWKNKENILCSEIEKERKSSVLQNIPLKQEIQQGR